ncbi:hypothetical protein PV326_002713 [Microctonus aethiopoides]|nr:hypothetical protein PV326_002713 [Microctonus aethiopoides]
MKRNQRKGTVTWRGIRIKSKSELAPEQRISSSSPVVVTGVAGCWIIYARVATTSLLECNSQQRTRQKRISHQAGSRSRSRCRCRWRIILIRICSLTEKILRYKIQKAIVATVIVTTTDIVNGINCRFISCTLT